MLRALDLGLLRLLRTYGHQPPLERVVLTYTRAGEHGLLWLAAAALGAAVGARPRRQGYLRALRVVTIAYLTNIVLKHFVRRARPLLEDLPALSPTVTSLSYPSAHSTTSFAGAGALRAAGLPGLPLYAAATAMALSRPYVGVHYPSDCLAGAALGGALEALLP